MKIYETVNEENTRDILIYFACLQVFRETKRPSNCSLISLYKRIVSATTPNPGKMDVSRLSKLSETGTSGVRKFTKTISVPVDKSYKDNWSLGAVIFLNS